MCWVCWCLQLCRRAFDSMEKLKKHEDKSQLHAVCLLLSPHVKAFSSHKT